MVFFIAEKMTKMPIEQEVIDELVHKWKRIEELFELHLMKHEKPDDEDSRQYEIDTMRREIKIPKEELLSQYERINRKMKKVLTLIEEQRIQISPDPVTEDEYHTFRKAAMGPQKHSFEDNTAELERCAKGELDRIKNRKAEGCS